MHNSGSSIRQNIILTGIPRSGTTLICRLLSGAEGVIALNEPMWPDQFEDRLSAFSSIETTFGILRESLLTTGTGIARTTGGKISDNAYSETKGERQRVIERGPITFDKTLDDNFILILKHCAEFTLLLPELTAHYPCFAIIRNPLALLGSWASVQIPVSRGKVAKSARLLPEFNEQLESIPDLLDKQLYILNWYFSQYNSLAPECVIKYEDIIHTKGSALQHMVGQQVSDPSLSDRDIRLLYDLEFLKIAGNALLKTEGTYWNYYSKDDVIEMLNQLESAV